MLKFDKYEEYLYNYSLFLHNNFELVKIIPIRPEINKNIFKSIYISLLKNSLYDIAFFPLSIFDSLCIVINHFTSFSFESTLKFIGCFFI